MGIKHLNQFLRSECGESIKNIQIAELSGKKIAIDISIYAYKYESNDSLIENIYIMLSIFRQNNITPVFVFDGKPPTEKKALLEKRREDKKEAEQEYNILKKKLEEQNNHFKTENEELTKNSIPHIINQIDSLMSIDELETIVEILFPEIS